MLVLIIICFETWINFEVCAKLKDRATEHRAINTDVMAEERNKYMKSAVTSAEPSNKQKNSIGIR